MDKKRILVVDDEEAFTRVVRINLEESYQVRVENTGRNIVDVVRSFCPDLIMMDVMMPDIDGCEVVRKLKEEKLLNDIPVVFITALVGKSKSENTKTSVNDYPCLAMPVSLEDLIQCIQKHLKKTR